MLIIFTKYAVILLTALIVLIMIFFLLLRYWRLRALQLRPPQSVELTKRPKILILYTDDCQQHTDAVLALCKILEENANAQCFVDQKEFLQNPTLRPGIWLTEKLDESDFVLVIFSECSQRVLAGHKLIQRRHFSDYFNIAIGFIISKINEIASNEKLVQNGFINLNVLTKKQKLDHKNGEIINKNNTKSSSNSSTTTPTPSSSRLNKFAFARFSYSPINSIPSFFTSTLFCSGFGSLELPQHIGFLIAWIHGILNLNERKYFENNRFEYQADLTQLNLAIEEFKNFEKENINWVDERFDSGKDEKEEEQDVLPQIEQQHLNLPNFIERVELAERFGLLPLDENDEIINNNEEQNDTGLDLSQNTQRNIGHKKYELIGKLEDYDSSSNNSSMAGH